MRVRALAFRRWSPVRVGRDGRDASGLAFGRRRSPSGGYLGVTAREPIPDVTPKRFEGVLVAGPVLLKKGTKSRASVVDMDIVGEARRRRRRREARELEADEVARPLTISPQRRVRAAAVPEPVVHERDGAGLDDELAGRQPPLVDEAARTREFRRAVRVVVAVVLRPRQHLRGAQRLRHGLWVVEELRVVGRRAVGPRLAGEVVAMPRLGPFVRPVRGPVRQQEVARAEDRLQGAAHGGGVRDAQQLGHGGEHVVAQIALGEGRRREAQRVELGEDGAVVDGRVRRQDEVAVDDEGLKVRRRERCILVHEGCHYRRLQLSF